MKPDKLICEHCVECAGTEKIEIPISSKWNDKPVTLIKCTKTGLMWREQKEQKK